MSTLNLTPAYGRTYKSTDEIKKAWKDGKDFKIVNGPYCSIRSIPLMKEQGVTDIHIVSGEFKHSLELL